MIKSIINSFELFKNWTRHNQNYHLIKIQRMSFYSLNQKILKYASNMRLKWNQENKSSLHSQSEGGLKFGMIQWFPTCYILLYIVACKGQCWSINFVLVSEMHPIAAYSRLKKDPPHLKTQKAQTGIYSIL